MTKEKTNFEFKDKNAVARAIAKYPEGREASAVLALLELAQRENDDGHYVTADAITAISETLNMMPIRIYEVASFFTMINLQPVGKYHLQLCGTTPCMLCGAKDIKQAICDKLKINHGETTENGMFTLTEVECLGACVNAPIVQINDDYYEDLSVEKMSEILDELQKGNIPEAGSMTGRLNSAPQGAFGTQTSAKRAD